MRLRRRPQRADIEAAIVHLNGQARMTTAITKFGLVPQHTLIHVELNRLLDLWQQTG